VNDRIRWLDVLRGVAILGIVPANVVAFAWPMTVTDRPAWFTDGALREWVAYLFTRGLFEYKFITLFSLLFGVGLFILRSGVEARGGSFGRVALRRFSLLAVIGALHVALLWFGDILFHYAVIALLVCWVTVWSPRTLKWIGGILIALPAFGLLALLPILALVEGNAEIAELFLAEPGMDYVQGAATGTWPEFFGAFAHFGPALEIDVHRQGTWTHRMGLRVVAWLFATVSLAFYFGWRMIGLFLLGIAFAKDGTFLRWEVHLPAFRRVLRLGLVTGVPLQLAALVLHVKGEGLTPRMGAELLQYLGSLALAAAYLGAAVLVIHHRPGARWIAPVEAVGRMALSNYLLQSVLCVSIVAGLGLFGAIDRASLWLLVLFVWTVNLGWSTPWLRRFGVGPVEWAWRRAAHGRARGAASNVPGPPAADMPPAA
jgi:uncharacterized protein